MSCRSTPFLALLLFTVPAPATVFDIADGDVAALISAIQASNANGEADVINLTAGGDYELSTIQFGSSASALPRVEGQLVINGSGATLRRSSADGTPNMRILITNTSAELTLNDLTVRDGFTTGFGGGINNSGKLALNDCAVIANSGGQGGGIFNTGVLEIVGGEISDNAASGGNGGGAIFSQGAGADATAFQTLVRGNSAAGGGPGGGIINQASASAVGGFFTIVDSIIEDNSANGINGHGGGIENRGRMSIADSIIRNNATSGNGGGLRTVNGSGRFLTVTESEIHDNTAGGNGGGLDLSFSEIVLIGLKVHGNTAVNGGGIHSATTSNTHFVDLEDCAVYNNAAVQDGGGIFNDRTTLNVSLCRIDNNSAGGLGGGIVNRNATTLTLTDTTVDANTALLDGGGVHNAALLNLNRSTVSHNISETGHGGGILNAPGGRLNAINATLSGNTATETDSAGGGLHNLNFGSDIVRLHLVTVTGNQAATAGGIYNDPASAFQRSLELDNAIVAGNIGGDINDFYDDLGHNLIGDGTGITQPTSFMGNPQLGSLADNGGPTLTHALPDGSIVIGAGDCFGGSVTEDQRGLERPQAPGCDIGAFELEYDDTIFADDFEAQ